MKKTSTFLLSIILTISLCACNSSVNEKKAFKSWTSGASAIDTLTEYVSSITDKQSKDYIPVEDRIAVFDMDGTLMCEHFPAYFEWCMFAHRVLEDPNYNAPDDVRKEAERVLTAIDQGNKFPEDMEKTEAMMGAKAFSGMTTTEYEEYVRAYMETPAVGFENLTKGDALYQPMLEVFSYLQQNEFLVYIVTGTDRFAVRTIIDDVINIPPRQVIGMDVSLLASNQGEKDGLEYVYSSDDEVVRGDKLIVKNVKMNKVSAMAREIGQKPVLAFGNSSGDASMIEYTVSDNKYKSHAFLVVNDDTEREYGNPEKSEKMKATAKESGWTVISMRDDFKTIYGEDVTKSID